MLPNHGTGLWRKMERMESKLHRPLIQQKNKQTHTRIATDDDDKLRRIEVPKVLFKF